MATLPQLRRIDTLSLQDFERSPVWVQSHGFDNEQAWYSSTDEETFRPWDGPVPVRSGHIFLVGADFRLADGTSLGGYAMTSGGCQPSKAQPTLLLEPFQRFPFWRGIARSNEVDRHLLYRSLSKTAAQVFPITFRVREGLTAEELSGTIEGFYYVTLPSKAVRFDR